MSKTVLIIDDDQTLVAPLKDGLESIVYRVAVAFDGLQGILQAHQARPDVIILDFHMPGGGTAWKGCWGGAGVLIASFFSPSTPLSTPMIWLRPTGLRRK